jgi:restriction endonuclease S subunit
MKSFKLGEVVDLFNGSTPLKTNKNYWVNGDVPWFTVDDLRNQGKYISYTEKFITQLGLKESSISLIPENAVLLCCTASVGAIAINKIRLTTNQQFNALVVRDANQLSVEYLYYWFLANMDILKSLGRATTIDYVSMSKLRDMDIQLPSLGKQHEVVETLDSVFAEIDLLEKNLELGDEKTDQLLQAVLNTSINSSLTNSEQVDASSSQNHAVEMVKLVDVCRLVGGGTPSKANPDFYLGDIPWATVRDMRSRWLENTEHTINEVAVRESSTNIIPSGNVVLASRVGLGKVIQLKQDTAINQDLRALIPRDISKTDSNYLYYWALSIMPEVISAGKGATVQGVTLPFLESLVVPLPSLKKQLEIVVKLDSAFAEIQLLRNRSKVKKEYASSIRDSLLSSAFNQEEAVA